jgi:hypothetical protein
MGQVTGRSLLKTYDTFQNYRFHLVGFLFGSGGKIGARTVVTGNTTPKRTPDTRSRSAVLVFPVSGGNILHANHAHGLGVNSSSALGGGSWPVLGRHFIADLPVVHSDARDKAWARAIRGHLVWRSALSIHSVCLVEIQTLRPNRRTKRCTARRRRDAAW